MSAPQPPYGYQPQPQQPQQPRKRHTLRNVLLGVLGAFVVLVVLGAALGGGKTPAPAASPAAPAATSSAAPSPAAAATTAAQPRVLLRFDGSGIRNSPPFNVGSGALTVRYSFDCAAFGGSGNFVADLLYGNQSSLSSDDQQVANALAASGSQTTTVYPQDPGRDYYLSVNSECSWTVKVSTRP